MYWKGWLSFPPEVSDQWEEKLVLGVIVPWRSREYKRTRVVSVTHLRLQPQCTELMRRFLEDWRNSGGRAADGWSKSTWPDGSKAFKSVKGPSGGTLSHMERPFKEGRALRTTLTAMFLLLKSHYDVYCTHYKKSCLMTCYFNQCSAGLQQFTHCFLFSLVYQIQLLAQSRSSMQAKPCMNRVYLLCAGVTHLCQVQQHMCPYERERLEAFISGVYYTLLGRIYCSEHGILKAGKDFCYLIFMKCLSDQLRNKEFARFSPSRDITAAVRDQKSHQLWLVIIQISTLHMRHSQWDK